ncbi:hypothetical protein HPB50_019163 [Hyalomma asiaticum]|uniref:Uncharacterized protein n=1 Tax=Hyalomma asiaticum TaxID=266040 RepID=A0ACB7T2S1_HYAAI|nr:hypothetical protein HPB50_019163 [Hyalomma asiaticum]
MEDKERGTPSSVSGVLTVGSPTACEGVTAVAATNGQLTDHTGPQEPSDDASKRPAPPGALAPGSDQERNGTDTEGRHVGHEYDEHKSSEQEKSHESSHLQPSENDSGSHDKKLSIAEPHVSTEMPEPSANTVQPTADLQHDLSAHDLVAPLLPMFHDTCVTRKADVPIPSSTAQLEPTHRQDDIAKHHVQSTTTLPNADELEHREHTKMSHSGQQEPLPETVCKIMVPRFAGESKYYDDESDETDWLHLKPMTTSSLALRQDRLGEVTVDSPTLAPSRISAASPITAFQDTQGSGGVWQNAPFSELREQHQQPSGRQLDHSDTPSACPRAKSSDIERWPRSHMSPSFSRFPPVPAGHGGGAFWNEKAKGRNISRQTNGSSRSSPHGSTRSWREDSSGLSATTRDHSGKAASKTSATAKSAPSLSTRSEYPERTANSGSSSEKWAPSRPPSRLHDSAKRRPLHPKQVYRLQPPWMKKVQRSYAGSPSVPTSVTTSSACTAGSPTRETDRQKGVQPEGTTPSSKLPTSPQIASSTTQAFVKNPLTVAILCAAILLAAVVTILLLFGILLGQYGGRRHNAVTVCRTEPCREYSRRLAASVTTRLTPCESFTHFVCDGWQRRNQLSVREEAFLSEQRRLSLLLRSVPVPNKAQTQLEAAAALFRSCEAIRRGEADELPKVTAALHEAGIHWPRITNDADVVDVLRTWLHASLKLHWCAVLQVFVHQTPDGTSVALRPLRQFERIVERHQRREFLRAAEPSRKDEPQVVLSFADHKQIDKAFMKSLSDALEIRTHSAKFDASELFGMVPKLTEKGWLAELERYGAVSRNIVYVSDRPNYVRTFFTLWKARGSMEMYLFLSWCVVQTSALYANRRLLVNFYDHDSVTETYHSAFCLSKAYLLCGSEIFRNYFNDMSSVQAGSVAHQVVVRTREELLRRLSQRPEMDANTSVVKRRHFPDVVLDFFDPRFAVGGQEVLEASYHLGDSLVDNWRSIPFNRLDVQGRWAAAEEIEFAEWTMLLANGDLAVLPYALSFPSFEESATLFMNQGGLGNHVASALSQVVYNSHADSRGADESPVPSLKCESVNGSNSDGGITATQLERLTPRVLALQVSLEAYRAGSAPGGDRRLEGFEDYSSVAMFFIASCYALCRGSTKSSVGDEFDTLFSSVDGFAEAFGCTPGSPMNPVDKCTLA